MRFFKKPLASSMAWILLPASLMVSTPAKPQGVYVFPTNPYAYCTQNIGMASQTNLTNQLNQTRQKFNDKVDEFAEKVADKYAEYIGKYTDDSVHAWMGYIALTENKFESQNQFDSAHKLSTQDTEIQNKIADDLDILKTNKTNVCLSAGIAKRQESSESLSKQLQSASIEQTRELMSNQKSPMDSDELVLEFMRKKDKAPAFKFNEPATLTDEQLSAGYMRNEIIAAPNKPVKIDLESGEITDSSEVKNFNVSRALVNKKSEIIKYVLDYELAQKTPVVYINQSKEGLLDYVDLPENYVQNSWVSADVWLYAQVAQYHQNEKWHKTVSAKGITRSTKFEELAKIKALNLDILYKNYRLLRLQNVLLATKLQGIINNQAKQLREMHKNIGR